MGLRILAWNLNHRARAKAIPSCLADVIASLEPDVIVLTEYVHRDTRRPFLDQLASISTEGGLAPEIIPVCSETPCFLGFPRFTC